MRGDDVSTETWRVIDEDGTGHAATVEASEGGLVAVTIDRRCGYPCDTPVRAAIAREAWAADIALAEILAPGQPSRTTPAWGPLPTAAEVEAHVARSAPARRNSGAPWARKHGDSSGEGVSIVYLAVIGDRVQFRAPTGGVWYAMTDRDRAAQWRPVDADGVAVERSE